MYLIRGQHNLKLFKSRHPNVLLSGTIGNFDGLHLGHQAILEKIKNNAQKFNAKTNAKYFKGVTRETSENL